MASVRWWMVWMEGGGGGREGGEGVDLASGAVGLAADQGGGDVGVIGVILQVDGVRHPAGQEELVVLRGALQEEDVDDVPRCNRRRR